MAMKAALDAGFSHALLMDADGQHSGRSCRPLHSRLPCEHPGAMILGSPGSLDRTPLPERVKGRRVGNWFANLETLWGGVRDSLFGFRVYPLAPAVRIMEAIKTAPALRLRHRARGEALWAGVRPINQLVPVHYPPRERRWSRPTSEYLRDNLLLAGTHTRLCLLMLTAPLAGLEIATTMETRHLGASRPAGGHHRDPGDARTARAPSHGRHMTFSGSIRPCEGTAPGTAKFSRTLKRRNALSG